MAPTDERSVLAPHGFGYMLAANMVLAGRRGRHSTTSRAARVLTYALSHQRAGPSIPGTDHPSLRPPNKAHSSYIGTRRIASVHPPADLVVPQKTIKPRLRRPLVVPAYECLTLQTTRLPAAFIKPGCNISFKRTRGGNVSRSDHRRNIHFGAFTSYTRPVAPSIQPLRIDAFETQSPTATCTHVLSTERLNPISSRTVRGLARLNMYFEFVCSAVSFPSLRELTLVPAHTAAHFPNTHMMALLCPLKSHSVRWDR